MNKHVFPFVFVILSVVVFSWGDLNQKEKGIPIIENQAKPLYGKIEFKLKEEIFFEESKENDLIFRSIRDIALNSKGEMFVSVWDRVFLLDEKGKYIKDIGRTGAGPGEFNYVFNIFINRSGDIYFQDSQKIHVFDKNGKFKKHIFYHPEISHVLPRFYVSPAGNFFAFKGYYSSKHERDKFLEKRDNNGNLIKKILGFKDRSKKIISRKAAGFLFHEYMEDYYMVPVLNREICFGKNLDYKLYFCDLQGNITRVIKVDEKSKEISSLEMEQFREKFGKRSFKDLIFPSHRPFFQGILSDEMGRIYVIRTKPILEKGKVKTIDIFGRNGRFLYRTTLPCLPLIIRNGEIYFKSRGASDQAQIMKLIIQNYSDISY